MAARKFTKADGTRTAKVLNDVVRLRDKGEMSWAGIAAKLEIAPRTARRLYDEKMGEGAHHGLLPGKGGRRPVEAATA
jgi:hypothetical protein